MQVIRDEENFGLMMIHLFFQWGVRRCNVDGCTEKPSTIIAGAVENCPAIGMCETHYQGAMKACEQGNPVTYTFTFDNFDAFKDNNDK
jgi:hypothetical protein